MRYLDRDGGEHDEVQARAHRRTFQHEVDHLDGVLFVDRVATRATFTTWEQFERHGTRDGVRRADRATFGRAAGS